MGLKPVISEKQPKIIEHFTLSKKKKRKKKNCALYKMWQISKEAPKKCEIEIFDYGRHIWINRRHMKIE